MPYIDQVDIDFHAAKDAETQRKRGFGFGFAAQIFLGPVHQWEDIRKDYSERRIVAIGCIGRSHYVVVYTWRLVEGGEVVRWIISARKANKRERRLYASHVNEGSGSSQAE